jgi:hypothetical protein
MAMSQAKELDPEVEGTRHSASEIIKSLLAAFNKSQMWQKSFSPLLAGDVRDPITKFCVVRYFYHFFSFS